MRSVLIVDDHAGFRAWAREVLADEGFEVLGEARDGRTAIQLAAELHPDVVLLDIQLPDLDGFAVAGRIVAGQMVGGRASPAIVLTSGRSREDYGPRLSESPHPFLPKDDLNGASLESLLDRPG